jgi:uroporphyrinogen decarboxylase
VKGRERLVAAYRRQPVDATPVWFMRQAGGQLPGYQRLRATHSVIEIARTPELCAEVSAGAVDALGVDGAVLFADVMLLVEAMGVELELTSEGPVIAHPVRSLADVRALRAVDVQADLGFVLEAIRLTGRHLGDAAGVIGICGAPFTLAAYLIEGGPSRDQVVARTFMRREPSAWHELLSRITDAAVDYVAAQADAGADAVQVFDSWAGSLSVADYRDFVAPYSRRVLAAAPATPSVHFATGSAHLLGELAAAGGDAIGVDWRVPIDEATAIVERAVGPRAIQGNLDPSLVLTGRESIEAGAADVLTRVGGRPGHVFNLGHAAPRDADPVALRDLASFVHDRSAGSSPVGPGNQPSATGVPVHA